MTTVILITMAITLVQHLYCPPNRADGDIMTLENINRLTLMQFDLVAQCTHYASC